MITHLVLSRNNTFWSYGIRAATWSHYSHIFFRYDNLEVIDSSFLMGGVAKHFPVYPLSHTEKVYDLRKVFMPHHLEIITETAEYYQGVKYDTEGIVLNYIPNNPQTNWQKRLWCFEYARVVLNDHLIFNKPADRMVGRHWEKFMDNLMISA